MADSDHSSESPKTLNATISVSEEGANSVVSPKRKTQKHSPALTTTAAAAVTKKRKKTAVPNSTTLKQHGEVSSSAPKAANKQVAGVGEDEDYVPPLEHKGAIKKIWSDNDEITLLKVYQKQENKNDFVSFYEAVHGHLEESMTKGQVTGKIRKLREKFHNIHGKEVTFTDHQHEIYQLSKQVWGNMSESDGDGQNMNKSEKVIEEFYLEYDYPRINGNLSEVYPYESMMKIGKDVARECLEIVPREKLDKLEKELHQFHLEGMERAQKRLMLLNKEMELIMKGIKAKGYELKKNSKKEKSVVLG